MMDKDGIIASLVAVLFVISGAFCYLVGYMDAESDNKDVSPISISIMPNHNITVISEYCDEVESIDTIFIDENGNYEIKYGWGRLPET